MTAKSPCTFCQKTCIPPPRHKLGYPRKKAFLHLTSENIRLAAAIGAYGQ